LGAGDERAAVVVVRGDDAGAAVLRGGVAGGLSSVAGAVTGAPQLAQKREPSGMLEPQLTQKTI